MKKIAGNSHDVARLSRIIEKLAIIVRPDLKNVLKDGEHFVPVLWRGEVYLNIMKS